MSGDLEGAREVMSARLSMGRSTGDQFVVWVESANLSMVERRLGNLDRAEELALQALAIDAVRGAEMSIAWTVNGVAAVAAAKGDLERAAVLVGMAAAMLERAGGEWPPDEREQHDETLATLTDGLSPDALAAARARGGAMSVEDGVAYALGAPEPLTETRCCHDEPQHLHDDPVAVFHRLHASGCFVMPNPWDVGSARALEQLGFPALATTSAGFAWTLGRADNEVTLDEALEHLRAVAGAVSRAGERRLRGRLRRRSGRRARPT